MTSKLLVDDYDEYKVAWMESYSFVNMLFIIKINHNAMKQSNIFDKVLIEKNYYYKCKNNRVI